MRRILFIILFLLIAINSYALNLSRVKTWNANDILTASDLNAEFNNITNHSIVNADIGASAGIVASKLDQAVAGAIGATTPNTGAFTTLSATGNVTLDTNTLFLDSSANNVGIGTTAPLGILQVGTSPTPGLIVTSAGNVGIGITNPNARLRISGGVILPSGALFYMVTGSCPAGTTDVTATYSNKFVRINATGGSTGGADTHTHSVPSLTLAPGANTQIGATLFKTYMEGGILKTADDGVVSTVTGNIAATNTGTTGSGDNVPAYVTAKACQVD